MKFTNFPIKRRYEAKRLEIEAWLARMETRSEHMGPVGTTADILEAQQKEQKVREKHSVLWWIFSLFFFN